MADLSSGGSSGGCLHLLHERGQSNSTGVNRPGRYVSRVALLDVRDHFDIPTDRAYLNSAFLGPLPKAAVAAGRAALESKAQPWTVTTDSFFDPVDRLR